MKLIESRGKAKTVEKLNQKEIRGGILNKYRLTSLRNKRRGSKKIKANKPRKTGSHEKADLTTKHYGLINTITDGAQCVSCFRVKI
jgi:hypothetical protein